MATGESLSYDLPYPLASDEVNVHGDIKQLVEKLEAVLPTASYSQIKVKNNTSEELTAGMPVYASGFDVNTTVSKSTPGDPYPILGLVRSSIAPGASGIVVVSGILDNINTTAYSVGDILYIGESGGITKTPTSNTGTAVAVVAYSSTSGVVIVEAKGNGTWGALKAGLA